STIQTTIISYEYQKLTKNQNIPSTDTFKLIYHNLPTRDRNIFIGREIEIKSLQELLSFESLTPRISVEGLGGVGKTTFVLDVAYRYLQASRDSPSTFEAIVFTSAKPQHFTNKGIVPRLWRENTNIDILRTIARTIKCPTTTTTNFKEAYKQVAQPLANIRTLLIIDNLDTLEPSLEVLSFLYELPPTVKVVITSRDTTPFTRIRLNPLTQTEGLALIANQATEKNVELTSEEYQQLYQITGGIPAAIIYAMSQLASGYKFVDVSPRIMRHKGDFSRFYFDNSMQSLKGHSSHLILMALALFPKPALFESVCSVAAVNDNNIAVDALAQLQQLSLISCDRGRYTMLPLTREYALSELATNPEFESAARNRWVNWYLDFAQKYGGKYEKEWNDYHQLAAEWDNISEVMEWCIAQDKYTDACNLWLYINCYTYSQGYRQNRLSYWDAPLHWLEWLIEAAHLREDLSTAAEMMSDYAWKLILIGQPKHLNIADSLLARAWKLNHHLTADKQANLAIRIVVWYIQFKQFGFAKYWLNTAQT
ncbi:MAG: ATP-binding protein, partial [Cyanobacteria bacterium J06635_10]